MQIDTKDVKEKGTALLRFYNELNSDNKDGGYLTIADRGFINGSEYFTIGKIPSDKRSKYVSFSQEKAHRVLTHWLRSSFVDKNIDVAKHGIIFPEDGESVVSSYQTRNPDLGMWGGAVLFEQMYSNPNIVSFSGLPELADEALSYILGKDLGLVRDQGLLQKIKEISNNPFVDDMRERFKRG